MADEDAEAEDEEPRRALKVTIPVRQHIQLHAMKVLTGRNMSQAVEEALDRYLQRWLEANEAASEMLGESALTAMDEGEDGG